MYVDAIDPLKEERERVIRMMNTELRQATDVRASLRTVLSKDFKRYKYIYFMLLPVLVYYIVFCYIPMYGSFMAFQNYNIMKGIFASPMAAHAGFDNFIQFFKSPYFSRVVGNTLYLNFLLLIFGFPIPIIFALLINEVTNKSFKRVVQTISYMPFFISMVVVAGIIYDFSSSDGLFYAIAHYFGFNQNINLLSKSNLYRPIYVISDIWQNMGFSSIIYISALSGINPELNEAAVIDGAGRWKRMLHITLPGISSTIIILFILALGNVMSIGLEKVLLLYSPAVYNVADVIPSYIYRQGIVTAQFSYSAAVGLFNSVINFIVLIAANKLSGRFTGIRLF
jgi:putative aldouronate transport system permease protein